MPGEGLVVGSEFLCLGIGQLVRPPDSGKDVIRASAQRLAGIRFRAARSVADHLMMQAVLQILAVHGDVVWQVRVRKENIGVAALYLLQNAGKVCCAQLELFIDHDVEIALVLAGPFVEAVHIIGAVVGVFYDHRHFQAFFKLP